VLTSFDPTDHESGNSMNLVNFDVTDAAKILKERDIEFEIDGLSKNSIVVDQKYVLNDNGNKILRLVTKAMEPGNSLKRKALKCLI
jgi:hypothetical protein